MTSRAPFSFEATFQHPLARRGLVEMVPTKWLLEIANPTPSETTTISVDTPDKTVDMDRLWAHLSKSGMSDPLIISAGRHSRDTRLEAGNHRIRLFFKHNVKHVPATVILADDCVISKDNGNHRFRKDLLIPEQEYKLGAYDEHIYMLPSDVFSDLKDLRHSGAA